MSAPSHRTNHALERATSLVREGRGAEAVALLDDAVAAAEAAFGPTSAEHSRALSDLGSILAFLGDQERAIGAFEAATERPQTDPEAEQRRLTALLNLAEVLEQAGRLLEAEDVARRSVQGRHVVYGPQHPGYAFGLAPLAQVLLRRGKLDAAREAALEAVANFRHHQHPRLFSALALLAEIDAARGKEALSFAGELDDAGLLQVAEHIGERALEADPVHTRALLRSLADTLEARLGLAHEATLEALTLLANLEAAGGDVALRERVLVRLLEGHDARGDVKAALEAQVGLALVSVERRDRPQAEARFAEARRRAQAVSSPEAIALVERAQATLAHASVEPRADPELVRRAAQVLEEKVRARAPKDLVAHLEIELSDESEGLKVGVDLAREASDSEKAALEHAIVEARREVFALLVDGRI